jgi:hypothetical protein
LPKKQQAAPQSHLPKQLAIKNLKMADYFKSDNNDVAAAAAATSDKEEPAIDNSTIVNDH